MKLISLVLFFLNFQSIATAASCRCSMDFEKKDGSTYTESVSVECPQAQHFFDLKCDGSVFAGTLTTTCSNSATGSSNQNSGWTQWDAEPTSSWPSCSL